MDAATESKSQENIELERCPHCSRTFNPTSIIKHVQICQKKPKQRQVFDSSQQRALEEVVALQLKARKTRVAPRPKSLQRTKIEGERSEVNTRPPAPRGEVNARPPAPRSEINSSPPVPRSEINSSPPAPRSEINSRLLEVKPLNLCPHCNRSFNIKAYDKHVEWCKEKTIVAAFSQYGKEATSLAKKRMEARTHYKAPIPKPKRTM